MLATFFGHPSLQRPRCSAVCLDSDWWRPPWPHPWPMPTGGTDRDSGEWIVDIQLKILLFFQSFTNCFAAFPFFVGDINFPSDGRFLQCENRICMIHLYRFTDLTDPPGDQRFHQKWFYDNVCRKLYLPRLTPQTAIVSYTALSMPLKLTIRDAKYHDWAMILTNSPII